MTTPAAAAAATDSATLPRVVLIGTLDTKRAEYGFAADWLAARGCRVLLLDVSTKAPTSDRTGAAAAQSFSLDHADRLEVLAPADLFRASSTSLQQASHDEIRRHMAELQRHQLRDALRSGCLATLRPLVQCNADAASSVDAIASFGGSQNTSFACSVMRSELFKLGLPKFCLTTMAGGDMGQYIGESDICIMPSISDISGTLNAITRAVLTTALGAIAGMAKAYREARCSDALPAASPYTGSDRPLVAVTMFGVTTPCVAAASEVLKSKGYEPVAFHATGTGGKTMEKLIRENYFAGVLDLTTTELCDDLFSGVLSAGPDRLVSSARFGVPTLVSVGALDMINFGAISTLPSSIGFDAKQSGSGDGPLHITADGRKLWEHAETVTLLRTTSEENRKLGKSLVERLTRGMRTSSNKGKRPGPTTVIALPLQGVSMLDKQGEAFDDVEAREALFQAIEASVERAGAEAELIWVQRVEYHINDPEFATLAAETLVELIQRKEGRTM